jgi:hypothetical protein
MYQTNSYICGVFKSIFGFGFEWVPSIFVSHNFHVRKKNVLHPSEAISDSVTAELLTLVLPGGTCRLPSTTRINLEEP